MKRWNRIEALAAEIGSSAVTIGNFDGLHLGHQAIVEELKRQSGLAGAPSVVMMFDPHPAVVLGHPAPPLLTTPSQRTDLLETLGVDHCLILPFTKKTAETEAREFIEDLRRRLSMKALCIGPTTHVGRAREGTPEKLAEFARDLGFRLLVVPPVSVEGKYVSSSRIREALRDGNLREGSLCLGRNFMTHGTVVTGSSNGRKLGFPTANLARPETMLPKRGVYATWVRVDGTVYGGVTNVGVRPTVSADGAEVVETHLFDFNGMLVHRKVSVEWVARLRDEMKFSSLDLLREQIGRDVTAAKAVLAVK